MAQVTWRAPDELAERVRAAAARQGYSMNEFLTRVLDAVTNPDVAGDEASRVRERLRRAGLLVEEDEGVPRPRIDPEALRAARARAAQGTSLVDLVARERE